ncbi:multicopper oxidase family protein [Marinospirillum sp.]|uniref:multicopper oxidase family protein n=1 Tax=Marinospirillum sp. TaxID=2183934 RepID=UPI00384EB471
MQRRDFLRLSALGFLMTPLAVGVFTSQGSASPFSGFSSGIRPEDLPENQALKSLPRLTNQASDRGFSTRMRIAPTEVALVENRKTSLWLYDGKLTPLIEVTEGDSVEVAVDNQLHQPTTIHWHGLRIAADQDGAPHDLIKAGEQKTYRFTVPEGNAGLHWFHPHPHDYLAEQIAHSLAGVFLVNPRQDPVPASIASHLLVVTDLRLDEQAQVAPSIHPDWMNGREGNLVLVNGQRNPQLEVAPGETFRLQMVNACAGRYLRLNLQEHDLQLIGTDGGYLEKPVALDELLLVPGQRCDLLVTASESRKQRFQLLSLPYDRGRRGPPMLVQGEQTETLLTLVTGQGEVRPAVELPARLQEIQPLGEPEIQRRVDLSEDMPMGRRGGMRGPHHQDGRPPMRFLLNGEAYSPGDVMFEGKVGKVEEWEVFNASGMDHPFHIHGTHFQVVAIQNWKGDWHSPEYAAWQDTVNLKSHQKMKLRMVFRQPGEWMFHCHIIEHEEMGMMSSIRITD